MDIDKAFEVINGLVSNPDQNTDGPFYTGGPSSPIGLNLPARTFYLQNTSSGVIIWRKFNTGVNDWRQLSAEDLPYDPTGVLNLDPSDTNVQLAIDRLGKQTYADVTQLEAFNDDAQSTTTSNGWVTKLNATTVGVKTAGIFLIQHSAQITNNNDLSRVGYRIQWRPDDGSGWTTLADVRNGVAVGNQWDLRTGFNLVTLAVNEKIDIRTQFGQTDDGGTGKIRFNTVVVSRVGEL